MGKQSEVCGNFVSFKIYPYATLYLTSNIGVLAERAERDERRAKSEMVMLGRGLSRLRSLSNLANV